MSAEAQGVPWLRLNAGTFADAALVRGGFWASVAWPGVLSMAKVNGWRGGVVPKSSFDELLLARHLNGSVTDPAVTQGLASGIVALVKFGLLEESATQYKIRSWAKYQSDPTNAERQERHRGSKKKTPRVTESRVSNGCNGDGTGLDGTGRSPRPVQDVRSVSSPRPAASGSPLGGSPAASPSGAANGNGRARILSPTENHERLAAALAAVEKPAPAFDHAAFESRRAASLAALAALEPPCESPPPPSSTKTNSDAPTPSGSGEKTSTDRPATDAP